MMALAFASLLAFVSAEGVSEFAACAGDSEDDSDACAGLALDDGSEAKEISLLQRAARGKSTVETPALGQLLSKRWGNLFQPRRRRSASKGDDCDGLFVKYSNMKVEPNLTFHFNFTDLGGGNCLKVTEFGPNECCFKYGSEITIAAVVDLPEPITEDAIMSASVNGKYGIIPIWDSLSCSACGKDCSACPTISNYLPSLFPCKPVSMPACPIAAGTLHNTTTVELKQKVGRMMHGSDATVKFRLEQPGRPAISSGEVFVRAN